MVSALAVEIGREVGVDRAQLGLAFAAPFAIGALSAPLVSRFVERVGPSMGLRIASGIVCLALLLMAGAAWAWWAVVAILGFAGLGTTLVQLSANLALAGAVPDGHQGFAFGAKEAAVPVASLSAGLLVPLVALPMGWRLGFVAAALIGIAGAVVAPRVGTAVVRREGCSAPWRPTRLVLALGVAGFFAGAVGNSLSRFVVDSAVTHGLGQGQAAILLAASSIAAFSTRLGVGILVDWRSSSGVGELLALTGIACCALTLLAAVGDSAIPFAVGTVIGFAAGWGWPGLLYYSIARANPSAAARATGFALSFVFVGTIVGPISMGAIAEHVGYSRAWTGGAIAFAAATVAAAVALRASRVEVAVTGKA